MPDLARSSSDRRLLLQVHRIVLATLSVNAHRPILACTPISLAEPVDVDEVGQGRESHLRALPSEFRYPLLFRGHVHGFRCTRHVSLQRLFETTSPSLRGVPSVWFPRFSGTTGRSDSLPLVSPHFVAFAWRYRRFVLFSSPPARDVSCGSTWSFGSRDSSRQSTTEAAGSLRFPSDPHVPTPCSRTPVGPNTPGRCGVPTRPPLVSTTEAPARSISRLNRTALGLAVYASQ